MRGNNRPKMKMSLWYLFTADRFIHTPEHMAFQHSIYSGKSSTYWDGLSFFFLKFRVCWQYGVIVKLCNRLYNSLFKILISGTKYVSEKAIQENWWMSSWVSSRSCTPRYLFSFLFLGYYREFKALKHLHLSVTVDESSQNLQT